MHFNDNYPQYELMAHHSEEEGKIARKKLWMVFWIMLAITILELFIGSYASSLGLLEANGKAKISLKIIFIALTVVKAAYIVLSFMHLGQERKWLRYTILVPYIFFIIYLLWLVLIEGVYSAEFRATISPIFFGK